MAAPRVVAIGDSITAGVGDVPSTASGQGWAALVAHALGSSRYVCVAGNGVRARDLMQSQVPRALMMKPDLVIISAGGNDVLRGDFDAHEVEKALRQTLERLRRPGRTVVVLRLVAVSLFDLCPESVRSVMTRRIDQVNEAIARAVEGTEALVIDGARIADTVGRTMWHIDRIHPSPRGHRALAAEVLRLLPQRFTQVQLLPAAPSAPSLAQRIWWLISNGVPWIAKRSRDLIPQVVAAAAAQRSTAAIGQA